MLQQMARQPSGTAGEVRVTGSNNLLELLYCKSNRNVSRSRFLYYYDG
jgi:hypothetical protein